MAPAPTRAEKRKRREEKRKGSEMNQEVRNPNPASPRRAAPAGRPERAAWARKTDRRLHLLRVLMVFIGSVVLLLGLLLLLLPCFRVKKIEVSGELEGVTEQELIDASGVQIGEEIIGMDLRAVLDRLEAAYPNQRFTVSPTPFSIKIRVEQQAVAYMAYGENYFSLDRDFRVLAVSDSAEAFRGLLCIRLPEITGVTVGQPVVFADTGIDRGYISTMLELFEALELTDRVDLLDVSRKFNVSYVLDGSTRIVLGSVSDLEVKLELAGKMLDARQGSADYAVVDVSDLKKSTYRPMESYDMLMAG